MRHHGWRLLFLGTALTTLAALTVGRPATTAAHPLGNFTINNYDRIEVSDAGFLVYHVLDMAEIPTFQERQKIDVNGDGTVDDAEASAYADAKAADLQYNLHLNVNGTQTSLSEVSHNLTFPAGQGGLLLLRLSATYRAALPSDWRESPPKVDFDDTNYADRLGWREIVVRNSTGAALISPSVPSADVSQELTQYPTNALSSPLDVRLATFSFKPGIGLAPAPTPDDATRATRGNTDSTLSHFADLIARDKLTPGVIVIALLAAMGFGALHALSPGHGKTVVGAYLVGSQGTAKHAVLLGLVVTATHTSTVYALGLITLYLSEYIVPERLYPWLGVASGALIIAMGLSLLVGRLRSSGLAGQAALWVQTRASRMSHPAPHTVLRGGESGAIMMSSALAIPVGNTQVAAPVAREHDHTHFDSAHGPDHAPHGHGFGPAHSHAMPAPGEKLNVRQLIGLGIFGGILPCPSAIVVMLSAVALHRVGFGLVLIVAFSLGLAGVLTAIGIALVYVPIMSRRLPVVARLVGSAHRSQRLSSFVVRAFPVASAMAVASAGLVILVRAMTQF